MYQVTQEEFGRRSEIASAYGLIQDWDVSQITDMSELFLYLENFNEPIGLWNVSAVTKTQVLGRTWEGYVQLQAANMSPATTAEVLGVTVGIVPRPQSNAESKRCQKCRVIAQRISVLPVSQKFRASLATLTLAAKRGWGPVLNGRVPTTTELKDHTQDFRLAVKGRFLEGTASRHLEKVLLLGHASDLMTFQL